DSSSTTARLVARNRKMRFMDGGLRVGELTARWGPVERFSSDCSFSKKERREVPPFLVLRGRGGREPYLVLRLGLALAFLLVLLVLLLVGLRRLVRGRRGGCGGGGRRRGLRGDGKRSAGERSEHQDCDQLFHLRLLWM